MPAVALTKNGDRITARTAAKGREYKCPHCGSEMGLAGGQATQYKKHFRHVGESCHDYRSAEETEDHRRGKYDIAQRLRDCEDAGSVSVEDESDGGIPDVHFNSSGDSFSVELQVSHISLRDFRERVKSRSADGLFTAWLFHADHYDNREVSKSGNEYVAFKTAEMAYINTVTPGADRESVWLLYYEPDRNSLGVAHKVSLFEDGGGGWVEATRTFDTLKATTLPSGLKMGFPDFATPEAKGDPNQARLF
jgi:competence CoiA-like predicted nuclease